MLRHGYDPPPLMFTTEEVEAIVPGARSSTSLTRTSPVRSSTRRGAGNACLTWLMLRHEDFAAFILLDREVAL